MWAPVRVVYEVLLRLGIMGRLLQAASRRVEAPTMSSPFPMGAVIGQASGWAGAADDILSKPLHIFGRDLTIGDAPDWHTDGNDHTWPQDPAWRLDLYSDEQRDVKHVWETARHRHLVILARAAAESPEKSEYRDAINHHLRSWLEQNPPEIGVHWFSNLELAIRALAWLEVLHLVEDGLADDVRSGRRSPP